MKLSLKRNSGFTLIELIMVIALLGFLAVSAIPQFFDLSGKAKRAAEGGVAGGVRGGLATKIANNAATGAATIIPAALDGIAATPQDCDTAAVNFCFDDVIPGGVREPGWEKTTATTYTGPCGGVYTYDSTTGAFSTTTAPSC